MAETNRQGGSKIVSESSEQVKKVPNPTGKGGFQDHPELINAGGRPKNLESFSYWMNFFKSISVEEFKNYENTHLENKRTMAEMLAYARVFKARNDLREFQEVANRTEGMPKISVETSGELNVTLNRELTKEEKELLDKIIEKKVSEI